MLVLTRKSGEAIKLGNDVKISILSIDADRVRIGIEAPSELKILRFELMEEIKNINKEALNVNLMSLKAFKEKENEKK